MIGLGWSNVFSVQMKNLEDSRTEIAPVTNIKGAILQLFNIKN